MEHVRKQEEGIKKQSTLAERMSDIEKEVKLQKRGSETKKVAKQFNFPFKWRIKFNQAKSKTKKEMMLVFFLNKKNQIEPPKFMPVFDGNMIVWENKPYEFDPRAIWTVRGMRGNPQAYIIKEIDRRPVMNRDNTRTVYGDAAVSNMDLDEVRKRGDSTESDAFLIKAALKAQTAKMAKSISKGALIVIGLIIVGVVIWLISNSSGVA